MIKTPFDASISHKNRGMEFETMINEANEAYINNNVCYIYKKPTPIKVVNTNSDNNTITKAYFSANSTTDYCGVYKGKYIDFEAKSTNSNTSLPLANIEAHQIEHMKKVKENGGISFLLVEFKKINEIYLLTIDKLVDFIEKGNRNSIPLEFFKKEGFIVKSTLKYIVNYIPILEKIFEF